MSDSVPGGKLLLVDDEPNVLQAYTRALRKRFTLEVADGGPKALELISSRGPYAVIVSDMRMPGMNGVELLEEVKRCSPNTVRMMLTGNSDQQTAIDAINRGDIFRFLNKPCAPEIFAGALVAGLEQYQLITAEKELLQNTLAGSILVLAEVLSLVSPEAFGRTARLQKLMRRVVGQMAITKEWWLEPLVLLSQIGCVILPEPAIKKIVHGQPLNAEEYRTYTRHPGVGSDLLARIPRMEIIAEAIRYQEKNFDGTGVPQDTVTGKGIPLGARILKVILDFEQGEAAGLSITECLSRLTKRANRYDPEILDALAMSLARDAPPKVMEIDVYKLEDGMVLAKNVLNSAGVLLLSKGQVVTPSVRYRLENYWNREGVRQNLYVEMMTAAELESGGQDGISEVF